MSIPRRNYSTSLFSSSFLDPWVSGKMLFRPCHCSFMEVQPRPLYIFMADGPAAMKGFRTRCGKQRWRGCGRKREVEFVGGLRCSGVRVTALKNRSRGSRVFHLVSPQLQRFSQVSVCFPLYLRSLPLLSNQTDERKIY